MMPLPRKQVVLVTQRRTHWVINHCLCIQSVEPLHHHRSWAMAGNKGRDGAGVDKWPLWMSNAEIWGTRQAHGEHKLQSPFILAELWPLHQSCFMLFHWLFTTSFFAPVNHTTKWNYQPAQFIQTIFVSRPKEKRGDPVCVFQTREQTGRGKKYCENDLNIKILGIVFIEMNRSFCEFLEFNYI